MTVTANGRSMVPNPSPARVDGIGGRSFLVTGGAGGIGQAVAAAIAAGGGFVGIADLDLAMSEHAAAMVAVDGSQVAAITCDVTQPGAIARALDELAARASMPIGGVVACAGVAAESPFVGHTAELWDRTMEVNLRGTFMAFEATAARMIAGGHRGAFVAISSVSGRSGRATQSAYAASKAGVISVVRSGALALAQHGIRVNAVCPGVVDTVMTSDIHRIRAGHRQITPEESLTSILADVPLGRIGSPVEVAQAVTFLLSDSASYITGQAINVCGGMEMN